ncbi:acetyl-CoA synthetase-like protein [Stipitochalara longipes BDJ]|nr:acetyl-CoA synthetase-like protein [Stipitochalara longipes BDJ]
MPGPTVTTVPVRLRLAPGLTARDLLAMTQDQASRSLPHEQLGVHGIARLSNDLRDACRLHHLFIVQTHTAEPSTSLGLACAQQHALDFASHALTIEATIDIDGGRIGVRAQFDPNAIAAAQLSHVLRHFQHIVRRLVCYSPDVKLAELTRINTADLEEIVRWQAPPLDVVRGLLHDLVARACGARPDHLAIHAHDGRLTYAELRNVVQQTACHFQHLGVRPKMLVPVCARKGLWAPVTFLAILSCGAAFLPLEPTWPIDRLHAIMEQFHPSIIFVSPDCRSLFDFQGKENPPQVFNLGLDMVCRRSHHHAKIPADAVTPSDLAFILMTSGSTGKPKGVKIQHHAIATHCVHVAPEIGFQPSTKILQFSSYAFDGAFAETFDTLIHGGTLCLPSEFDRMNNLARVVDKMQANMIVLTPALLATLSPHDFPTLKTLIVAGDRVLQHVNDTWAPKLRLLEGYGPAESCIATSIRNASDNPRCGNLQTPSWCALWVTDPQDPETLVPIGATGELLIQGPVLASGYAGDDKKTLAAFIPPPRWMERANSGWTKSHRRLYRTGDLVRQLTDGTYQFIGRHDNMRKHRGQRLELEEIEHHLRLCLLPSEDAIVELVEPKSSAPCIVAFIQHKKSIFQPDLPLEKFVSDLENSSLSQQRSKALEDSLSSSLPPYMVPSLFLVLEQLPFLASGKVNRKLLREAIANVDITSLSPNRREILPSELQGLTSAASVLRQSWAETLGLSVEHITGDSVWHRLGGDSIRAMHLNESVRRKGYQISVHEIISAESLTGMAERMVDNTNQGSTPAPMLMSPNFAFLPSSIDLEKLFSLVHDQCNVEPESIADILPATPLQVEFMASTSMNSNAYISRQIWDLPKDIDLTRFQWAWFSVSHSMPILRTRLVSYGADVFQVLLHTLPTWDWASDLDQYLESDRKHDYRLGTELMHFGLVQNGNARKQFVWTCHHSLYDGRFMELIMKQLLGYYANAPFPTLTPFNAYIKYLREGDAQIEREFWQKKMKGATTLSFPENLDGTDSAVDGCIEMRMTLMHDNSGARYSTTLCIQSALALVLARWANSDDVMFAVTLNGRTAPIRGIDNLAGPTMSTVPLRCLVELTKQADTLMEQIRATLLELTPYQHAGISGTRRMTNKMWDLTTHLIIQPHKSRSTQLATETFFGNIRDDEAVMMDTYSINIECTVTEMSTVDITLRYKSHALDETSAKRFLHQFVDAAKQISLGPTRRMADISLLTEQDRAQIVEWNAMPVKTEEYLIHDRIHSIADMHADEAAIYSWDGEATYGQLRIMSTRLASELIAKGIGPESMVALVFDKSINAVIAMLAVLTAGGCLVPFDASHPLDRLKMMIRGVNAKLILCSASRRALCEEIAQDVLVVNAATLGLSEDPIGKAALAVTVRPDNAAYVIHTSGSTGKPKAIVITHGQYTSGDHERVKALRELSSPRSLQFVSYAFDQSLQDILSGLMIGACICIPSQSMRESVADLVDFMRQAQVNSVMWPPSFAQLVNPEDVPDLKVLDVGGEPNTKELVRKWAGRLRLVNSYGPAEASVTCTTNWHIDPSTDPRDIGTGLNMRTWIVEKDNVNRLCPVGVIGELLLDGPALARGYLNDPKKTAAAFISPPAWAEKLTSATRMYRTGDLVKYSASGSLLYIGRIDSQVKIRGNRIQLEEIQCCILRELPGVRFAIEAIRPTDKQQNALCVFIATTEDSGEIAEGDTIVVNDSNAKSHIANLVKGLKHRLAKTLPSYMLPQYFLPVYKLPRTTSDKLDRKRLVAEAERLSAAELLSIGELSIEPKRAPETTVQAFFQSLWAEVLDLSIDHIGLDDDFVEIGGDSISAMQLAAAARERNWRLSVADIFAHRTLEAVSGAASRSEGGIVEEIAPYSVMEMATTQITKRISKLLNVPSHDIQDALPCTQFQEDMVLRSLDRPGAITVRFVYNIAGFDVERFKIAWQQCHEAHPALRIRVVQLEGIFIQAIIKDHAQWAVADSLEDFLDEDKKSPMTTGDRLNRCALVYQSEKPRYFVWTAHHAIFDGWALEALMKEVCDRYSGKPITLPDPGPASFLHHLKGLDRTSMAAFWRQELSGLSSKPMLAFDFEEHPLAQQWEIRHIRFCIPPGRMFTPAILLQFSWALLLSVASASDDVVLELMLTGRTAPVARLAHTLFPTVAVVPLRFRYSPGDNVMDALLKMQTHTHGLVPYEQFGWQSILALDEEIRHTLHRSAIPLIIHPAAKQSSTIAPNLELTTMSPMLHHNVAIQFECSLDDTGAETMILFDERLLTKHKVEQLLDAFEAIVAAVVHADANATLDRILNTEAVARVTRLSGN